MHYIFPMKEWDIWLYETNAWKSELWYPDRRIEWAAAAAAAVGCEGAVWAGHHSKTAKLN